MSTSSHDLLRAQYEQALRKLASVLELEYAEVLGMFGKIDEAVSRASKIVGFFQSPEINAALKDVILVAQEYQAAVAGKTRR